MSQQSLAKIETAIEEHFASLDTAEPGEARSTVTAWFVGVELARPAEFQGDDVIEWRNSYAASVASPNTINGLAADVQARIEYDTSDLDREEGDEL